jgi:transposase-like protein
MSMLSKPYFHDEEAAYAALEALLWPQGPVCPHCGAMDKIYKIAANTAKRVRHGLYKCGHCKKQFTAKVGTVFEQAHIPLHKCLQAAYLMASSKKGISSNQLARTLEITVKSAWFLSHRIREAMADDRPIPMGGEGTTIEADETYYGPKQRVPGQRKGRKGPGGKAKIITLVQRGGAARSFKVENTDAATVKQIVRENVAKGGTLMTDEAGIYAGIGSKVVGHFAEHGTTMHSAGEYVKKGDRTIHSNTVEGFFSIFKRGMSGVYQHCDERHLHRYLAEFDFRYSNRQSMGINDQDRAAKALRGIAGKRLTYRQSLNG